MRPLWIVLLIGGIAFAQTAPAPPVEEQAKQLFDEGARAYAVGNYDAAIVAYQRGYELLPRPIFLYNLAQAYRLSGRLRLAATEYTQYLTAVPDAKDRVEVEVRIAELNTRIASQDLPPEPPPPSIDPQPSTQPTPAPALPLIGPPPPKNVAVGHPIYTRWWFWTGVAVVAAGGTATAIALSNHGPSIPSSDLGNYRIYP